MTDYFFTFLARIGVQVVIARDAVGVVLHLDVLASVEGLVAVLAVEPIVHDVKPTSCEQRIHSLANLVSSTKAKGGSGGVGQTLRDRRKGKRKGYTAVAFKYAEVNFSTKR